MKIYYSLLLSIIFLYPTSNLLGQCEGDIILSTQEEVDNFVSNYGCEIITGDLIVGNAPWPESSDINNVEGLSMITSVTGDLTIRRNDSLTSLEGLENVTTVGGELVIGYNNGLVSLQGLANLSSIGIGFIIIDNDGLTSLAGIPNLTTIDGYIEIAYNGAITSLEGLENLTYVGKLNIDVNHDLISLEGLDNLTYTLSTVHISENNALTSLNGLEGLTTIGGTLIIADNPELLHVEGLQNLTSIGNTLFVAYCDTLTTIEGFQNLTSVGKFDIFENPNLDMCCSTLNFVASAGSMYLAGNKPSCNSIAEITQACMETATQNIVIDDLNVYPNPSNGVFTIVSKNAVPISWQILNSRGAIVLNNSTKQQKQLIDLSKEASGLYFVQIKLDDKIYVEKIVKNND